jgi:hypothetical protein
MSTMKCNLADELACWPSDRMVMQSNPSPVRILLAVLNMLQTTITIITRHHSTFGKCADSVYV